MGIFFFFILSVFELCIGISARADFAKNPGLTSKNFRKSTYKYFSYLDSNSRVFKKINFFKKKTGFFLFFKDSAKGKVGFLNLCFFYFYINRMPILCFIENILFKKISRESLVFFFIQVSVLEKKISNSAYFVNFVSLSRISDLPIVSKLLFSSKHKKLCFNLRNHFSEISLGLEKKNKLNSPASVINKYNSSLSSNCAGLESTIGAVEYLFLLNNFFTSSRNFFFLRNSTLYNKSRYSRNRQTYRTGVFWCIWLTVLTVIGLYFYFYVFLIKFTYAWVLFFIFIISYFFYYFRSKVERHFFF